MLTALNYYSRIHFISNLLPLIKSASALRRVVVVAGGGLEGHLDTTDFPALRISLFAIRGHLCSLISLGLEATARTAPEVSFVHDFPGAVNTALFTRMQGLRGVMIRLYVTLLGRWVCVPIEESGERHLYFATSARFPSPSGNALTVPLGDGVEVAQGTTGAFGSGVYSLGWDGETASSAVQELLADMRDKGLVEEVWRHTESEFKRITANL